MPAASHPHMQAPICLLCDHHRKLLLVILLGYCQREAQEAREYGLLHSTVPHGCSSLPGTCHPSITLAGGGTRLKQYWFRHGSDSTRQRLAEPCPQAQPHYTQETCPFCGPGKAEIPYILGEGRAHRSCSHCREVGGSVHLLWLTGLFSLLGQGIKPQAHGPNMFTLHLLAPGPKHWPANATPGDTPWGWFSQEGKQLEWCRIYGASCTARSNNWSKAVVG